MRTCVYAYTYFVVLEHTAILLHMDLLHTYLALCAVRDCDAVEQVHTCVFCSISTYSRIYSAVYTYRIYSAVLVGAHK